MDALKSAGRAIIRSPSLAKQSWTTGRHRKLPENWTDTRETILEGMTFNLRQLGMTLVDQPKGEDLSAAAVKRIVATAKASGKKPQKVALKVSPQGIVLHDSLTNKLLENVSIYRHILYVCLFIFSRDWYKTRRALNRSLELKFLDHSPLSRSAPKLSWFFLGQCLIPQQSFLQIHSTVFAQSC
uniref:Uncharacterized protein n=1 Tax=Mola mola TaxID=94237 RepID=A0A3Q4BZI1_MOLML